MSCKPRYRDTDFENIDVSFLIVPLYIFYGGNEGADIQDIVPHEKVAESGHGIFLPNGLTKLILIDGNIGLF